MDKMREEFEAQAIAFGVEPMDFCTNDNGDYEDFEVSAMWAGFIIGWKASRAALCVELPDFSKHKDGDEWWAGYTCAVSDVKSGLNQIGVPYK